MIRKHVLLLLILLPVWLFSQESMGIRQCLELGLERNFDIRIVRNEQQISDNNYSIGNAGFLPTLDLSGGYSGKLGDNIQENTSEDVRLEMHDKFDQTLNAGIYLNWTIFNGMAVRVNYKQLEMFQQMGELNTRLTIENFMVNILSEYFNCIQQNIRLKNLKTTLRLSKDRLRIVEARYMIGAGSGLELQQARVDFNADSSLFMQQQEYLFASRIKLNELIAADNIEQILSIKDSVITIDKFIDRETIWQHTLSSNTFLLLSDKNIEISRLDLKSAKSDNYPYLRLSAGYAYDYNKLEQVIYDRQQNWGLNYSVTMGIKLFDGMNRSLRQKNAQIELENKKLNKEKLEAEIKSDFANTWMRYNNNLERTNLETVNVKLARETYQAASDRYLLGDLSGIELREVQTSLLNAEERLVETLYNTKLCEILLMQISGQITRYLNE